MRCELKKVIITSLGRKTWPARKTICVAVKEEAVRRSTNGEMGELDAVNLICSDGGNRCPKVVDIEQVANARTHLGQGGLM